MTCYTLQGSKFPRVRSQTLIVKPLTRAITWNFNREHYIIKPLTRARTGIISQEHYIYPSERTTL